MPTGPRGGLGRVRSRNQPSFLTLPIRATRGVAFVGVSRGGAATLRYCETNVMVLQEILEWSSDRPPWQRDALRRLVLNGELSDEDIVSVTRRAR